jgi:hypothetical protein
MISSSPKSTCILCGQTFYDQSFSKFCSGTCYSRYSRPATQALTSLVTDAEFEEFRLKIMEQMADYVSMDELPPFDPTSKCVKCGFQIEEPPAQPPKVTKGADGKTVSVPAPPPPPPKPPTVQYCNGADCSWADPGETEVYDEHMHQFCDVCGYEWLASPLG